MSISSRLVEGSLAPAVIVANVSSSSSVSARIAPGRAPSLRRTEPTTLSV